MTKKIMQINFLSKDTEIIKDFLEEKDYSNLITYDKNQDSVYIDISNLNNENILCSNIVDLIVNLVKKRNLKEYIDKTYTKITTQGKQSVYQEALSLFDKKENYIKETVYNKIQDLIVENRDINLDGFFKFRMKDFNEYISIISDIALEEYLIKRDKKEFLDSLKYLIHVQEEKMNLLRIIITKDNTFILSDEEGNELNYLKDEELKKLVKEEELNDEDILISAIMTLCPQKIEILNKSNNAKSRDIIEIVSLLFEGKVTLIYSN